MKTKKTKLPRNAFLEGLADTLEAQAKPTHTPLPWKYHLGRGANPRFHIQTECGYQVASTTELVRHSAAHEENAMREADAAFIVRAVNAHEELLDMVYRAIPYLEEITKDSLYKPGAVAETIRKMKQAIAKAENLDSSLTNRK